MLPHHIRQLLSACKRRPVQEWKNFVQTRPVQWTRVQRKTGGYLLLIVPVATFCLGTWQVKRRVWKLALIESLQEKTTAPSVELPFSIEEIYDMEYRKVVVRGKFDHSREMYIQPRSLLTKEEKIGVPRNGAFVVTPFILSDRDWTILVNRGWVPKAKIQPEKRVHGQVSGEIELVGLIRLQEKREPLQPKSAYSGNVERSWLRRDLLKMAEMAQSLPIFIDAVAASSVPEGPIGGQTRISVRNDHLSYIFTWYGLSAATAYMWYIRFGKGILLR